MSVSPFSQKVDTFSGEEEVEILPFIEEAKGGEEIDIDAKVENDAAFTKNFLQKSVHFLGSLSGLLSIFVGAFFVMLFLDMYTHIEPMYTKGSFIDSIYLLLLAVVVLALGISTYSTLKQLYSLKNIQSLQEAFSAQHEEVSKEIIPLTQRLLREYINSNMQTLVQRSTLLKERMSSSHDYAEIYKELDEVVLEVLDKEVQRRIKNASAQAALSTAISPLALIDAGIVLWRSVRLSKEIATLYGYKPGWISTIALLKRGSFSIFFAGASELAIEYMHEATSHSFISKVSQNAGQGVANGVLIARLGYGVMQACRPLPMRVKREVFVVSMLTSLKEILLKGSSKNPS